MWIKTVEEKVMPNFFECAKWTKNLEGMSIWWNFGMHSSLFRKWRTFEQKKFDFSKQKFFGKWSQVYKEPVWPDWAIYWTLGNFLKPLATINLPKSPTFLSSFCEGVKIYHFSSEIIFGNFYRHLSIFSGYNVRNTTRENWPKISFSNIFDFISCKG